MAVAHRLGVECKDICARFSKRLDLCLRMLNHEMHVKDGIRRLSKAFDDGRSNRDIGHERAVHNIDVNVIRARIGHAFHLIRKM